MSSLPFAVEIAAARAQSEEAHAAGLIGQRARVCLQSVDILARQHSVNADIMPPLPGEELIAEAAVRWPDLAAVRAIGPREETAYTERLQRRKSQLELVLRHVGPIALEEHERAHHLAHLQEDQQRVLAEPQWASDAARLRKVGAERDAVALKLAESQQKAAQVRPLQVAATAYLDRIAQEARSTDSDSNKRNHHIRVLADDALLSLASLLSISELELAPLPSIGEPVEVIIEALTQLNAALSAHLDELQSIADVAQTDYEGLTQILLDDLG